MWRSGAKTLTPWFSHQKTSLLMPIFLSRWELWRVENMMIRSTCGWLESHFGTMCCEFIPIWGFLKWGYPQISPNHLFVFGCSIINHPAIGVPPCCETPVFAVLIPHLHSSPTSTALSPQQKTHRRSVAAIAENLQRLLSGAKLRKSELPNHLMISEENPRGAMEFESPHLQMGDVKKPLS